MAQQNSSQPRRQRPAARDDGDLPRSVSIGEDSELEISIFRTVRVRDATDPELQPVSKNVTRLGALPMIRTRDGVYEVAASRKLVSNSLDLATRLYATFYDKTKDANLERTETDAMAVHIKPSPCQFKLKMLVGGVNVANPTSNSREQGYYVSKLQEWVDGVYIGNGRVRQFVALPTGTG